MAPPIVPPREATRPLNLRAPLSLHARLAALAERVPAVSAHRLAVVALELGMALVERDPGGALVRPAPNDPPRPPAPAPAPRAGAGGVHAPPVEGEALRGRYTAAVEGGATHVDLAREVGVSDRTLRAWSKGERGLGADVARRVARVLARRGL